MHHHRQAAVMSLLVAVAGVMACDSTAPATDSRPVSFSVATAPTAGAMQANAMVQGATAASTADAPLVIGVGADTLRIDSVRVVLAQVTLARAGDAACGTQGNDDSKDSSCSSLNSGPFIAKLPLTAGAISLFDVPVPKGAYTRFAVRVHKPNRADSGPNVQSFLDAHPDWENKSIKVDGTFNGVAVHWSHDPVAQLEHTFNPAIVVDSGANFTLRIDVGTWFRATTGALIDPNAKTNTLYPQIALNVKNSFSVFRDDRKSGQGQP